MNADPHDIRKAQIEDSMNDAADYNALNDRLTQARAQLTEARDLLEESKQYLGTITGWSDRREKLLESPMP